MSIMMAGMGRGMPSDVAGEMVWVSWVRGIYLLGRLLLLLCGSGRVCIENRTAVRLDIDMKK
jgi:hypothetical protein